MSRIEVTELVPGEEATSADVNATLNSWNTGTASGSIGTENVAMEGIDRKTMSAVRHVVYTTASGADTTTIASTGGIANITGVYVEIPGPLTTPTLTFSTDQQIIVHATTFLQAQDSTSQQEIKLIMQVSTNGGAWTDMVGTEQIYQVRDCYSAGPPVGFTDVATPYPGIVASASWGVYFTAAAGSTLAFRIAYKTSLAAPLVTFENGVIFTETFRF